ncbi:cryptochrome/photolyase family protein [Undibacterium sp. LX40W]|uniref:Cryptochrome/photolyase family protein n=1 Tax=Undibacterium nitidum TaxID=2762298 RepID=A0A923KTG6_9BURK|nr:MULTISPECIES: cryptochrome/photolyase family protein [Undibacterium]MBC3882241.1 cryptochrome/photolyase family protein [Undibacterium nitidum]MBC3892522.1 cryptochrome/photolyase family protein [Undibacterium sp. LX40W]
MDTIKKADQLRLILGDQLNRQHSWFAGFDEKIVYVLMEVRQETDYVLHHAQKIIAIFAAMRAFAQELQEAGHRVHYLKIDDLQNQHGIPLNMQMLAQMYGAEKFAYQAPDEWRLDQQLSQLASDPQLPGVMVDTEHFYTSRAEVASFFSQRKQWLMEAFYRSMRVQHHILVDEKKQPIGGAWNFDHDNRKSWPGLPWEPADNRPRYDHSTLWDSVVAAGVKSFGEPQAEQFRWPLNRNDALQQLQHFIQYALPNFGEFQDAMSSKAWRLFHSMLSFALNVKMLSPREVVNAVLDAYQEQQLPLASVEGFIRQIIGWREYVRGVYWHRMPHYEDANYFAHQQALPEWFWNGETKMRCMATAISQSLQHAHAHHIQRLMVIGNFSLLVGLDPKAVHQWYLGIYIDAFEWVELPNTIGMSQYADGGHLATKPYVSSAAYIDRMSDYCKGCHYNKKLRLGEDACPFNALYWDFHHRHENLLGRNPRLGIVYKQLRQMKDDDLIALKERARYIQLHLHKI